LIEVGRAKFKSVSTKTIQIKRATHSQNKKRSKTRKLDKGRNRKKNFGWVFLSKLVILMSSVTLLVLTLFRIELSTS